MNAETISLTLGVEELLFLLRLMRAETLPGLPERPFEGMTPEQIGASLVTAERGLQARGVVRIHEAERRVEMDAIVMALLGVCLVPRFSILVTSQRAGQAPQVRYYHIGSDLVVEHTSPKPGLHTFVGAVGLEDFAAALVGILNLPQRSGRANLVGRIRQETLTHTREQARSADHETVVAVLQAEGQDRETADALAATLRQPDLSVSFTRLEQSNEAQSAVDGFALIEGADVMWAFNLEPADRQWLRIEAISTGEAIGRIRMIMRSRH